MSEIIWDSASQKSNESVVWDSAKSDVVWDSQKPTTHDWGTTDARDFGKKNSGMSSKLTTAEAGDVGKKRLLPSLVEEANKPIFGAMAVWDKAASVLGRKETTAAQDWYGDTFMRQASRELEQTQREVSQFADKDAEFAYKIPETVGKLAGQMLYMIPGMQAAPQLQKSLGGLVPTLVQRIGHESAQGILAGTPMAATASAETYHRLIKEGVPEDRALLAATVSAANTYLQVAAPVTVAGALPTRAGVAGSFNVAGEKSEEFLINQIVSKWPDAQVKRTDVDSIISFVTGGTLGAVLGKKGETKPSSTNADLEAEVAKFVDAQRGAGKINPEAGIDASEIKSPYYDQSGKKRVGLNPNQVDIINRYNEAAAKAGQDQLAGNKSADNKITNEAEYNRPYWPDEDLQSAIEEANYRANDPNAIPDVNDSKAANPFMTPEQLAEAQKWADQGKPGYGQMEIPPEAGNVPFWPDTDLEKAKAAANRRAGAIDNLPNAAELATDVDGIQSPYMNRQQLIDAQNQVDKTGQPAHSEMEIPVEAGMQPYWPDKQLERAKATANRAADKASQPTPKQEISPELSKQIDDHIDASIAEADKLSDKESMARFLKVASKKQGGHIGWDLSENTGLGFSDLAEVTKKAAINFWANVPESYKVKFKDAYYSSKEGTPTILFHGSNKKGLESGVTSTGKDVDKPFDKYDPKKGDGHMVHVGTADSATMINDSAVKNSRYIHTQFPYESGLNTFEVMSFRDFLLSRYSGQKVLDLSPSEMAKERNDWYNYRLVTAEGAKKSIERVVNLATDRLAGIIRKLGTKKFSYVISHPDAEIKTRLQKKFKNLGIKESAVDIYNDLHDIFIDLGIPINSSYFHSFTKLKNIVKKSPTADLIAHNFKKEVLAYHYFDIDSTVIPMKHHMRPLITSVKNPLMMRDVGRWADLDMIVRDLLPPEAGDIRYGSAHTNDVAPLSPQLILGLKKGTEFTNDLLAFKNKYKETLGQLNKHFDEFHKILEKYGFDAIAYENQAEAMNRQQFVEPWADKNKNKVEPTIPVISLGIWDASKIHDLVDVPRVPKGQRGSISLPGLRAELPDAPKTVEEAVARVMKDIGAERYIPMTVNQKALFLRNPVIKFAYDKLREFTNEADVRFNKYKTYLTDVEQFIKNNRTESLKMLKVLSDIQNPDLKDQRQVAQDTNTREQFLAEQGMPKEYIPMAIKILNVMQAVGTIDQANALKGMGHNWNLEPMYFPREHTGPFSVTVVDASGKVVYMKGFDDSKLAQQATTILKDKLKGTDHVVDIARHEPNTMGDLYNMLNINAPEKMPEFLKNITDGMLKEIEVAKRKFEMERSTDNIAGYTGETVYNSSNPLSGKYKQDTKLITLLQRRLEQSFQLETKARLLSELSEPLLSDPMTLIDLPNTRKMVKEMFAREMGLDISKLQVIMKDADRGVEAIGKIVNQIMAKAQGYEPHDVSYFKPNEIARAIQAMVWTMSTFKLALSPATLLANTTTMFATPMSGVRTASKRNISQAVPLAAFLQTSTTMAGHFSPELKDFLKDAQLEGMVEARVSDPLELTGAHTARGVVDKTLNTPRDVIEKATNFAGLAYYYNFFRLAYPDLDPKSRQFKTMVYEEVRSWTGDYSPQSQLLAISKGGAAGNLMSNFAKWKFNQLGRFWDDVRDLGEGKVAPIMVTTALSVLMAGMAGAPIAVTYEGLRRFGMMTGWWDWKPLSGFLYDLKDKGELGPHADWLIKGPLTQGADMVGKEFDLTMPDLSGNLKHASALDVNTMPFQFMADTAKLLSTGAKQAYKAANNAAGGSYPGATIQEQKEAVKGLPVVVGNVVRQFVEDRASGDSNITQYASEDAGQYPQNKQEKALAYLGLKSKAQNEYTDKDYTKKWVERYEKKQFGKYTDQMLANLNNPKVLEGLAEDIFELKGLAGIEAAIEKMKDVTFKRQTDVQTRETIEALQNKDTVAAIKALERLKSYRPSK